MSVLALESIRSLHFLGVCGAAMGNVAALLAQKGFAVSGSDENVYPPMSDFLRARGISIASPFSEKNLAHTPHLVVVGNAMKRGNPELEAALERKLRLVSLPEVVREFFLRGKTTIVVAGTHGKTTTTALAAWIFEHAGLDPGFLVGGIPLNFGRGAKVGAGQYFLIEGDEYDTAFFDKRSKFVHYLPDIALINNIEFDHADIFESLEAVRLSFRQLVRIIPRNGLLLANGDDANARAVAEGAPCPVRWFGLGADNDLRAEGIESRAQGASFKLSTSSIRETSNLKHPNSHASSPPCSRFSVALAGEFNTRNALAAIALARHCGIPDDKIQAALATFRGVQRRMEVRGEAGGVTVVDDFAHHPTALRQTLAALRQRYPQRRLWACFEPRSNTTRRNVFQRQLAEALALADGAFIGRVDRLNELAENERLDPEKLVADIRAANRAAHYGGAADELLAALLPNLQQGDVVAIFSNGGFGGLHEKLLAALQK